MGSFISTWTFGSGISNFRLLLTTFLSRITSTRWRICSLLSFEAAKTTTSTFLFDVWQPIVIMADSWNSKGAELLFSTQIRRDISWQHSYQQIGYIKTNNYRENMRFLPFLSYFNALCEFLSRISHPLAEILRQNCLEVFEHNRFIRSNYLSLLSIFQNHIVKINKLKCKKTLIKSKEINFYCWRFDELPFWMW